jgi:hypothetical protein
MVLRTVFACDNCIQVEGAKVWSALFLQVAVPALFLQLAVCALFLCTIFVHYFCVLFLCTIFVHVTVFVH